MTVTAEQTNMREIETVKNGDSLEAVAVFEYGGERGLMDLIQRSIARTLDLQGAVSAQSFDEVLENYPDPAERQKQIERVGAEFDEAFVNFLIYSMLASRHRKAIIRASRDEGIDGYLPWQSTLSERLRLLKDGAIIDLAVEIERFDQETETPTPAIPTQRSNINLLDTQSELEPAELSA